MESLMVFFKINVLLVFSFGAYWFVFRKTTFHNFNRAYLIISSLLSIGIPMINFENIKEYFFPKEIVKQVFEYTLPEFVVGNVVNTSFDYIDLGIKAYGVISLILLFVLISKFIKSYKFSNNNSDHNSQAFSFLNQIRVSESLPRHEVIYAHEQVHVKQLHYVDLIFFEILKIIFWINPVIYFYNKAIRILHEFIADAACVHDKISKLEYGKLLLANGLNTDINNILISPFFNSSTIKNRIMMLSKSPSPKTAIVKFALVLPLIAVIVSLSAANFISPTEILKELTAKNIFSNPADSTTPPPPPPAPPFPPSKSKIPNPPPPPPAPPFPPSKSKIPNPPPPPLAPPSQDGDEIFSVAEVMPEFPGGVTELYKFIGRNIKYPKEAAENKIEGIVFLKFVINKNGATSDIKILKGIGSGCEEEAFRVVSIMPKWKPGIQNKKKVAVYFNMPITFKLDNQPKKVGLNSGIVNSDFENAAKYSFKKLSNVSDNFDDFLGKITVNGKEVTKAEANALNPDKIKIINLVKGKAGFPEEINITLE